MLPPCKLTIEPGTIVRGVPKALSTTPASSTPGCLVITRGAKIIANGTPDDPIYFTSLDDPYVPGGDATIPSLVTVVAPSTVNWDKTLHKLTYSVDGTNVSASNAALTFNVIDNAFALEGLWGGVIILGRTPVGIDNDEDGNVMTYAGGGAPGFGGDTRFEPTSGTNTIPTANDVKSGNGVGFGLIEGLDFAQLDLSTQTPALPNFDNGVDGPSNLFRPGVYGGNDENDNSGVMRFCTHRFGGFVIGSNNEINGLTAGAVGRNTVIEWQEIYNNQDDGYELFGGYNKSKYIFSLFNGDDGIDGDEGFQGSLQSLFVISDNRYVRSGFTNNTITNRLAANASDKLFEWDGSENNNLGVTPNTNPLVYNFTGIGNRSNSGAGTGDDAFHVRRSTLGSWNHGLVEDFHDRLFNMDTASTVTLNTTLYFSTSTTITEGTGGSTNNAVDATVTQLRGKGHVTKNGLDPRIKQGVAARVTDEANPALADSYFADLRFNGCMRDNTMLGGWSILESLQLLVAANVDRPEVTLTSSGTNPVVSFAADPDEAGAGDNVLYVIERSSDLRTWTPVVSIKDGDAGDTGAAGTITYTDTLATIGSTPVHYRVIPQ
ncbi:MAG: hypothetical protein JNG86_06345 [Verrucomicrobiaceae bacterium]|nr:hypothetical protein [Verrucomicrobiaceae bacterium]